MVEKLIKLSNHPLSGFFLYNHDELLLILKKLEKQNQKTILLGVSFALIEFIKEYKIQLSNTIVMETIFQEILLNHGEKGLI